MTIETVGINGNDNDDCTNDCVIATCGDGSLWNMESGTEADFKLIELAINYFLTFPDTCHHPKEDMLFRQVIGYKPDEPGVIGDLIGEHKELSQLTHSIRHELNSQSAPSLVESDIIPVLKVFLNTYRHHIETENKTFFPYVMKNLSQEEFDIIDFDLFDKEDPVYDSKTEGLFSSLRKEILAIGNEK